MRIDPPDVLVVSHQRCGTHFLVESLASHPSIRSRGECVLQLTRSLPPSELQATNATERVNVAIVMYNQIATFERHCAPLSAFKIIHLLRNPHAVALSLLQKYVDREALGDAYRAHDRAGDPVQARSAVPAAMAQPLSLLVGAEQAKMRQRLAAHSRLVTVTYEQLTDNRQTNTIDPAIGAELLSFLGLPEAPLTNAMLKRGVRL